MYWEGFSPIGFVQVNSCVTVIEITLHTMSDVVIRLIILRVLALVKGFITSTGFLLLERQLSWVITFITEEIYLFDTIIPQLDHMDGWGIKRGVRHIPISVEDFSFLTLHGFYLSMDRTHRRVLGTIWKI